MKIDNRKIKEIRCEIKKKEKSVHELKNKDWKRCETLVLRKIENL
jgi:hypothetical protein